MIKSLPACRGSAIFIDSTAMLHTQVVPTGFAIPSSFKFGLATIYTYLAINIATIKPIASAEIAMGAKGAAVCMPSLKTVPTK